MSKKHPNPHIGISLDEWLDEDGLAEEVDALVQKRAVAEQLREAMERRHISVNAMAKRLDTSRTQVNRILDPADGGTSVFTLARAAAAVGCRLEMTLAEPARKPAAKPKRR